MKSTTAKRIMYFPIYIGGFALGIWIIKLLIKMVKYFNYETSKGDNMFLMGWIVFTVWVIGWGTYIERLKEKEKKR